jgi:hypothetical protein
MKKILLLISSITLFLSCIDPVKFNFSGQVNHLVIQSTFNNKKGQQYIRIAKSSAFGSPYNIYVSNANVYISSIEGEKYQFKHTASGKYFSDSNVAALAGHTYTLHVEVDGKVYESEAIKLIEEQKLVKIDNLHTKFAERYTIVKGAKEKKFLPGYDILVDYKDIAGEKNFYRWSFHRIYSVETQPENYVDYTCRGCPRPAPKSCCKFCWVNEADDILSSENDWLRDGKNIENQMVMFIPFYQYMNKKMILTISQHMISEESYNYFKALKNQAESTGSMFDAPPTELKGNIFNIKDKSEKVIGYFEASLASTSTITINGVDINYKIPVFDYPDDCLTIENATTIRPANW